MWAGRLHGNGDHMREAERGGGWRLGRSASMEEALAISTRKEARSVWLVVKNQAELTR